MNNHALVVAVVCFPLLVAGITCLFCTPAVQHGQVVFLRRFPALWWPLPVEWIEPYFASPYSYWSIKILGTATLAMALGLMTAFSTGLVK